MTTSEKSEIWPGLDCIHTSQLEKLQHCCNEKKQPLTPQNKLTCKICFNILLWTTAFYFKNLSQFQNLKRLKNLRGEVSQQQTDERVSSLATLMHTVENNCRGSAVLLPVVSSVLPGFLTVMCWNQKDGTTPSTWENTLVRDGVWCSDLRWASCHGFISTPTYLSLPFQDIRAS